MLFFENICIDRQTDRHTDTQAGAPTDGPTGRQIDGRTDGHADRQTDKQAGRRTDGRAGGRTDKQTNTLVVGAKKPTNTCRNCHAQRASDGSGRTLSCK